MPPTPCVICGRPCAGKAQTCSPECKQERRRRDQQRFRERQRGGPRQCVVCQTEITAQTSTNTCSPECWRAHRLKVPPEQLPPLVPLAASAVCDVCGKEFTPWRPRQKGCSPECMKTGRLRRKLEAGRQGPYPPRPCVVCRRPFTPDRKNGRVCPDPECRAQHKRDLAAARTGGQLRPGNHLIFCTVCGKEVWAQWNTLTCESRECVRERRRQVDRKTRGILPCSCIVCGERFWPPPGKPGSHYTCSDRCARIARLRKNRRSYEANRDARLTEQARRMREDPEYRARRQEIDREYRKRRAALLLEAEAAVIQTELQRRLDGHDETHPAIRECQGYDDDTR